ncbi:hypothetical protein D5H75_10310 [Bailinhaonella thermotolerans]|uniref:N,N-dimethylformamidase beta subunit-like C-terminal domain-containing protein n=1 Tax=Bailinhaonella thermotolerans TaxID=1070861 RepID=A0A3A4AUC9_9ACTN|nr:hypothetical protein D5H75_10310 [Bailinhaonella thermotolerans]
MKRQGAEHEIEGYADQASVLPGQSFKLLVSTTAPTFTVRAYRMGWYGGALARRVWQSRPVPGRVQPKAKLIPATRTVSAAHWTPSLSVDTTGWPEGSYLLRLDASTKAQRYVPITVRSASTRGKVVIVNATTTWQAYNHWGDHDLYQGPRGRGDYAGRSRAVSFDRPYDTNGARLFMTLERSAIEVAEKSGVPLAYITSLELDRDPAILRGARALISLGHDEYWSPRMRRTVTTARDKGTNLAFLGANSVYWRIRFEKNGRLIVCYKEAVEDPLYGVRGKEKEVTALWRGDPAADPESSLIGPLYDCFPAEAAYVIWQPGHWIFKGTGVRRGTSFPGMLGVESDKITPGRPVPRPLEVLAKSPLSCGGRPTVAHSAYYTVPSGAAVFNAGTMRWVCAMRGKGCGHGVTDAAAKFSRKATDNILKTFAKGPAAKLHPAKDNLADLGLADPLT